MSGILEHETSPFPADGAEQKIRLLICCSDAADLSSVLTGAGYEVHSAAAASDGISEFNHNVFAAVIVDADMAPVDGFAFRSMIRARHARIPVLIRVQRTDDSDETLLNAIAQDINTFAVPSNAPPELLLNKIGQILSAYQAESKWNVEQKEMQKRQDLAGSLQKAMLPPMLFSGSTFEYGYLYGPHRSVSGDLVERIPVSADACVFVFGKLSGRGIHAALSMTAVQSFLKNLPVPMRDQPYRIADELNRFLLRNLRGLAYMCTLIVYFDFQKNLIRSFNAGYTDMFCFDLATGQFKELNPDRKCGVPVGMMPDGGFTQKDQIEAVFSDQNIFAFGSEGFFNVSVDPDGMECLELPFFRELLSQTIGRVNRYESLIAVPYIISDFLERLGYSHRQDDVTLFVLRKRPENVPLPIYFNLILCHEQTIQTEVETIAGKVVEVFHDAKFSESVKTFLQRYLISIMEIVRVSHWDDTEYIVLKISASNGMLNVVSWYRGSSVDAKNGMPSGDPAIRILNLHKNTFSGVNECIFSIPAAPEVIP